MIAVTPSPRFSRLLPVDDRIQYHNEDKYDVAEHCASCLLMLGRGQKFLLDWQAIGGHLLVGQGEETGCFDLLLIRVLDLDQSGRHE
jgi:hypothetical protein